jgi:glycosyltransferase involved in cell wall biosynthesis
MKLSIIVPVYNEINTLKEIVTTIQNAPLPEEIADREIVIVDDFSTDGTRELLRTINDPKIKIVYHEKNCGKGAALRTGFKTTTGDILLIQDADLEYDPHEYGKLLKPILDGKADVVYGSRFTGGDSHRILYFWHSLANKILTLVSNMFSDLNLTDMETCYKVFRREVIKDIQIEENRFGFEPEITAKISDLSRTNNIRIYEVGISYYGRTYEQGKKIKLKDAFRAMWCILKYNTTGLAHLFRYGANGVLVALSQFLSIIVLVELAGMKDLPNQNIANIISIEISVLFGFFLHSFFSWRYKFRNTLNALLRFLLFHAVTAFTILARIALFYFISTAGTDYRLNTIIGIVVVIILNFIGYEKIVFKTMRRKQTSETP